MIKNPFSILRGRGQEPAPRSMTAKDAGETAMERIGRMVASSDILVLMKGSPQSPRCGFSANTMSIIGSLGLPYSTIDVLADEEIRAAAKDFAQWPTFPQVYVRGEFVGGNDIVTQMHASGELARLAEGGLS